MFLYFSMVRSSYIIILSGMGDDVPILGALVTLFNAMGNCCFWWCFYTSVWSDHHISSFYPVWEMTCQFWGLWSCFLGQSVYCCFYDVSVHQYGQIIIYHQCIRCERWFPNFGALVTIFGEMGLPYHVKSLYWRWRPNFGGSGHAFWGNGHLVNMVIWWSGHLVNMVNGHLVI